MPNRKEQKKAARREYTKKQRAAQEEETRRRIVEAAVALHQEEGGGATVSEIARRAGVARVTLYRHFPDELALLTACTTHYLSLHPPPDLERWRSIPDPIERLRTGLAETYAYHRQTEAMMTVAEREVSVNPTLAQLLGPLQTYWSTARNILAQGWQIGEAAERLLEVALGLALSLSTWRTLTSQHGLSDADCVTLFVTMIRFGLNGDSMECRVQSLRTD
jgi:AcrR family transcriptional regulator